MQLRTHIAIGLLFGIIFYYFFNLDFYFVFLTALAAFLPDIDWSMQFRWGMGERHRTFLHNVWAMIIIIIILYFIIPNLYYSLAIALGFLSHMLADSFTVSGVYWLWPYGREKNNEKFFFKGPINMTQDKSRRTEKTIQSGIYGIAGFLFLSKGVNINIFSFEGIIAIIIFIAVGYWVMGEIDKIVVKIIRDFKI